MDIELVRITPDSKQKYVLVRAGTFEENQLLLWGNPAAQWHKDVVEEIAGSGYVIVEVIGGGRLHMDSASKALYVWGKSDRFGPAPEDSVEGMLRKAFPEYDVLVGQEPE